MRSDIETVNYLELAVCAMCKSCQIFFPQKFKTTEITVVSQGALVYSLATVTLRLVNGTYET